MYFRKGIHGTSLVKLLTGELEYARIGPEEIKNTGKDLVVDEFKSPIFGLLLEDMRLRFQDNILQFMNKHSEIFTANLLLV